VESERAGWYLTLLDMREIHLIFFLLEILEFCSNFARSAGNLTVLWRLLWLIWCDWWMSMRFFPWHRDDMAVMMTWLLFWRPRSTCVQNVTTRFTRSRDTVGGCRNIKWATWPDHTNFRDDLWSCGLPSGLLMQTQEQSPLMGNSHNPGARTCPFVRLPSDSPRVYPM